MHAPSKTTIYERMVKQKQTTEEDNTSVKEMEEVVNDKLKECRLNMEKSMENDVNYNDNCCGYFAGKVGCSTSGVNDIGRDRLRACMDAQRKKDVTHKRETAEKLIQEAERSKLLVHNPPGNDNDHNRRGRNTDL